jgi:hypothetical protein
VLLLLVVVDVEVGAEVYLMVVIGV